MRAGELAGNWRSQRGRKAKHLWPRDEGTDELAKYRVYPMCGALISRSRTEPVTAMKGDTSICYDCLATGLSRALAEAAKRGN